MEIVKGKRTKRQRPYSPTDGGGDGRDGGYFSIPSPGFSGEISVSTEEEEDMANCLILLAQGFCPKQEDEEEGEQCKIEKFGKGLIEMGAVTTGKAGFYVYECKTCNRTFPSFQALGGHRASHKKPKMAMDADRKEEQELGEGGGNFGNFTPPPSLHMAAKPASNSHVKSNKVHECSICGSEFSSGQALGGHMRRHRAAPTMKTATSGGGSGDVSTGESQEESHDQYLKNRPKPLREGVNILSFDLNLPAPTEDEHQLTDSKFEFRPSVKHLVFSAPALVDCHY